MAAGEPQSGWVEKERFDWNILMNMNGFAVLGEGRGWIYVVEFESGSCSWRGNGAVGGIFGRGPMGLCEGVCVS